VSEGGQDGSVDRITTVANDGRVTTNPQQLSVLAEVTRQSALGNVGENDKGSPSASATEKTKDNKTRRKVNKFSSEPAGERSKVSRSARSEPESSNTRPKSPFFSKLVRLFLPRIASSRAYPFDVDTHPRGSAARSSAAQMQVQNDFEQPAKLDPSSSEFSAPVDTPGIPLRLLPDANVILPPPPSTQLLPQAETEGVTSGAVQPPGSAGEDLARDNYSAHIHASGNESVNTKDIKDEEVGGRFDDIEDDEDRLIQSGGAGIPIGPLSILAFTYLSARN
jgi:RNA polymerase II subunit A small phosphatase-like protein